MGLELKYGSEPTINPLGWADEYDFDEWLEEFFQCETLPEISKKGRGPWRLLIVSHPNCRLNERFFVSCKQNRIICFSLSMKHAKDLDPFLCGVTNYIEEKYTEKLQGRWVKREDKNAVRLKSSTFVNTFSKMAIDCDSEQERMSVIREAWDECALFSSSSGPGKEKAASSPESEMACHGKVEEAQTAVRTVAEDADIGWLEDTSLSISESLSSHTAAPLSIQQATPSPVKPVKTRESSSPKGVATVSIHRPQLGASAESSSSTAAQSSQRNSASDHVPRPSKRQKQDPPLDNGQSSDATIKNPNRITIPSWPRDPEPMINHPPTAPRALLDRQAPPTANGGQISRTSPSIQCPDRGQNHKRFASDSSPSGGQGSRPRGNQSSIPETTNPRRSPSRQHTNSSNALSDQHGRSQPRSQTYPSNAGSNSRKRSRPRSRNQDQPGMDSLARHTDQSHSRNEHAPRRDHSRPSGGISSTIQRNQYPQRYRPTTPRSSPTRPLSPAHRGGSRPQGSQARPSNGLFAPTSGNQAQPLQNAELMQIINRQNVLLERMEARLGLSTE